MDPIDRDARERQKENPYKSKVELLAWAAPLVPESRDYLLTNGYVVKHLDAMPPMQVVLLYKWMQYEELRDECIKWGMLPVSESQETFKTEQDRIAAKVKEGTGVPFSDGLPPLLPTFMAELRSQRRINLFRAIEALRMYAAEHGRLAAAASGCDDGACAGRSAYRQAVRVFAGGNCLHVSHTYRQRAARQDRGREDRTRTAVERRRQSALGGGRGGEALNLQIVLQFAAFGCTRFKGLADRQDNPNRQTSRSL